MITYTCIQSEPRLWTTGFTDPVGTWQPESDHGSRQQGFRRAAWLNGTDGNGHVYRRTEPSLWTVGTYSAYGEQWEPESDHGSKDEAARTVAELNGSDPQAWTDEV